MGRKRVKDQNLAIYIVPMQQSDQENQEVHRKIEAIVAIPITKN